MTKLESLREVIIKANPSILDLEFGCETNVGTFVGKQPDEDEWYFAKAEDVNGERDISFYENINKLKILGRKIGIAEILLTMIEVTDQQTTNKEIRKTNYQARTMRILAKWDLKNDDLANQSDETLTFLWELLCEK